MVGRVGEARPLGMDSPPLHPFRRFFYGCIHEDHEIAVLNFVECNGIELVKRENPVSLVKHAPEPLRHKSPNPVVSPKGIPVPDDACLMRLRFFPIHGSIPLQFFQEHLITAVYLDDQRHLPEGMG